MARAKSGERWIERGSRPVTQIVSHQPAVTVASTIPAKGSDVWSVEEVSVVFYGFMCSVHSMCVCY